MSRPKLAILLPPSEGKAPGGELAPWQPGTCSMPALDATRARVMRAAGGTVALDPTLPAGRRYTGVLYRELDPASLAAVPRRRFEREVLIFSGMWGVVSPSDPIPYYRQKMQSSLPPLGKLSTFWRPVITEALAERLAGHVVWDLLPQEHSAAWEPAEVRCRRRFTVRFVTASGTTVSHWNKLGKGALVRHLLQTGVSDPAGLGDFDAAGYRFDASASDLGADPALLVFRAAD